MSKDLEKAQKEIERLTGQLGNQNPNAETVNRQSAMIVKVTVQNARKDTLKISPVCFAEVTETLFNRTGNWREDAIRLVPKLTGNPFPFVIPAGQKLEYEIKIPETKRDVFERGVAEISVKCWEDGPLNAVIGKCSFKKEAQIVLMFY